MQRPNDSSNDDQPARLLDLLPEPGSQAFGSAMIRLAYMAAAQHRAQVAPQSVKPWAELSVVNTFSKDKAEHGSPAVSRSVRAAGPVTTEGDR